MKHINLSAWALTHQGLILYFMIALTLAGIYAYQNLGQAEDPEFTIKVMVIQSFWPGATATEVEHQVTDRLEKKLQEVPWLDHTRSYSKPGESMVFVELQDFTPPKQVPDAWYQVRKKVQDMRHTLPSGVRGPFFNDEFGDTFGIIYAFTADGLSHAELRNRVDGVRQEILRIPTVEKVDLHGGQEEKIFIEMSNTKLATLGISPLLIFKTLQQQNEMSPAGSLETPSDKIRLRVSGDFDQVESLREIGIRANNRLFRLGDITHIYRGYTDPPSMKLRYMGEEAIGLAVSMADGGDIIALGETLEQEMVRIISDLPIGIDVHKVANQPKVVQDSIQEFLKVLAEAVAIVLLVSFLSLGGRTGLVVALSIPLVLGITFLFMLLFDINMQRISLGALIIALGLLVDDAMIAVEMMAAKMEQGWDRIKAASFAYTSTAFPMLTGTLITVAGFLPVGFARSSAGEYTFSIFSVVTIALLVSWVVAVLFIPYLGTKLLPDYSKLPQHNEEELYQKPFYTRFRKIVIWCVNWRKTVIFITLIVFGASIVGFQFVQKQFFPSSNRPELMVDLWLPKSASISATEAQVKAFEKHLQSDPGIENYVAYVGGGSPRFYLPLNQEMKHDNLAQFVILTKDNKLREEVFERLSHTLEEGFFNIRGRVKRLQNGPPVGYPIQYRVSGMDNQQLRKIATGVARVVAENPWTQNVNQNWNELSKVIRLEIDQNKARVLGISSQELSISLNTILSGLTVTQFREKNRLIDVIARSEAGDRDKPELLLDTVIPTSTGRSIPLSQIATVRYVQEEPIIWRRNRFPTITVRADITGGLQAPVVAAQITSELAELSRNLPSGYSIEIGGTVESSAKAQASIRAVLPWAIMVVITILMIQLQSFQRVILVLLTAPLGIIGVTVALLAFNVPFGFVSTLGVIALSGMIMRNSVILVDQIEQDIVEGYTPHAAIIEATVRRFRPIVLTAAAAVLAMIPLSQSNFWAPMAISIMGGLIVATLLTLCFLPALYAAWFKVKQSS